MTRHSHPNPPSCQLPQLTAQRPSRAVLRVALYDLREHYRPFLWFQGRALQSCFEPIELKIETDWRKLHAASLVFDWKKVQDEIDRRTAYVHCGWIDFAPVFEFASEEECLAAVNEHNTAVMERKI